MCMSIYTRENMRESHMKNMRLFMADMHTETHDATRCVPFPVRLVDIYRVGLCLAYHILKGFPLVERVSN